MYIFWTHKYVYCVFVSDPHEEFPLGDEEFSGGERAETLIHRDEEERSKPEGTAI